MKKKKSKVNTLLIVAIALIVFAAIFLFFVFKEQRSSPVSQNGEILSESLISYKGLNPKSKNLGEFLKSLNYPRGYCYKNFEIIDGLDFVILKVNLEDRNKMMGNLEELVLNPADLNENFFAIYSLVDGFDGVQYMAGSEVINTQRIWANLVLGANVYSSVNSGADYEEKLKIFLDNLKGNAPLDLTNTDEAIEFYLNRHFRNENIKMDKKTEFSATGHFTYEVEDSVDYKRAFIYLDNYDFMIKNGVLTLDGGISLQGIITFEKIGGGVLSLKELYIPGDEDYQNGVFESSFPAHILEKIGNHYNAPDETQKIKSRIEKASKEYLRSINRQDAGINLEYPEFQMPCILAENEEMYQVIQSFFSDYPYYLGSLERVEENIRYVYSFDSKREDGDILTYKKERYDDKSIEFNVSIKLQGGEYETTNGSLPEPFEDYMKELIKSRANQ